METRESFKQIESGLCWHSCLQNICLEEKKNLLHYIAG